MIYGINLAPHGMPVCLHCGELGPDGALFCPKCGFTLPQVQPPSPAGSAAPTPSAAVPGSAPATAPSTGFAPTAPPSPPLARPYAYPVPVPPTTYIMPTPAGAAGPIPPPPSAKYCNRCGTLISRVAVYCPVCQQPQS